MTDEIKTIMLGDFDKRDIDYLSELIADHLAALEINVESFAFHIEVEYREKRVWWWGEAFSKFGFDDGDGPNMTDEVAQVIENLGYETECDTWGIHNYMIMDIRKNGQSIYPKIIRVGYTNPAFYLPRDIIAELDEHFGPDESMW